MTDAMVTDAAAATPAPADTPADANAAPATPEATPAPADASATPAPAEGEGGEKKTLLSQDPDPDKSTDAEGDKDESKGAPETYEKFELPEGMQLDDKLLESFTPLAKELNLTQEQAQKLVSFQSETVKAAAEARDEAIAKWATDTESDKEIGGKDYEANLSTANNALQKLASPQLIEMLDNTGLGNHPEVVRLFMKMGNMMADDKMISGAGQSGNTKEARLKAMFPSMEK